jgi:uncharacterized membrane protein YjjP (DUF1212 family)
MDIGEAMLTSGAEIHRVEDSMNRILSAMGAVRIDTFIITSCMIVSASSESGEVFTETRRITSSGTDFEKLHRLNDLSRRICSGGMSTSDIKRELDRISSTPVYPLWIEFIFYALISSSFTLFFGGTIKQGAVSLVIGLIVRIVILISDKTVKNRIFAKFSSSLVATALAYLSFHLGLAEGVDQIIIGNIMVLIPGIGLTNAIRDLFTGDSVSGILRSIEACLIAIAIAGGYFVYVAVGGGAADTFAHNNTALVQILAGTVGSLGFAMLFNIREKRLWLATVGGFLSWTLHVIINYLTANEVLSYLLVSFLITVYAEVMARVAKTPTTTFIMASLVPLIPGASLYYTMRYVFAEDMALFSLKAVYTLELASALALGVILASAAAKIVTKYKKAR